jgi:hypothetical protein
MVAVGPIAERKSKPASSWWKPYFANPFGLAAASLALAALTVFFATQNLRLRNELERSRSAQLELQSQVDKLRQPVVSGNTQIQAKVEPPQLPHISMASIMLSPGLLRSGGGAQSHLLMLPRGVSTAVVMLRLEQSMKYSGFDVVLQTVDGKEVRRLKALKSRPAPDGGYMVAAHFPARLLEEGDYLVTLQGRTASGEIKDLDSYSFSVTR